MRDTIDMAREAGYMRTVFGGAEISMASIDCLKAFEALVRADERDRAMRENAYVLAEREQIARMIEDAPPLVEFAQNDQGGCMMCGFTPCNQTAWATLKEKE